MVDEVDQLLGEEAYADELVTLLDAVPMLRGRSLQSSTSSSSSPSSSSASSVAATASSDSLITNNENEDNHLVVGDQDREGEGEEIPSLVTPLTRHTSPGSFVCFASATGARSESVQKFAPKYLRSSWQPIVVDPTQQLPPGLTHGLISIPRIRAFEMLRKLLNAEPAVVAAIIFVNDPHRVQVVCEKLAEMNLVAAPLSGESTKEDRKVHKYTYF